MITLCWNVYALCKKFGSWRVWSMYVCMYVHHVCFVECIDKRVSAL